MQVWAAAAILTVEKAAREGWWQADGLSMISASAFAYHKLLDMLVWLQFAVYLAKI